MPCVRSKVIHAKGSVVATGLSGSGDDWNEMGGMREAALFSTPPLGGGSGWDGDENWNLDQTGLVIVDGSVLGRSSAINQAYVGNYDLWTPSYGGATITWGGSKSQDGKSYDVLTVTPPKSSVPIDVWFDRQLTCRSRWCKRRGRWSRPLPWPISSPVQGLMIPYRVDTSNMNRHSTSFTVTSVEVDPPGGASHLTAPTSSPHDFSIANRATQASVPIQISKNQVWLDVMLNGKGPFHFAFDTGGANVIDPAVAKELGVASGGSAEVTGVGSAGVASSFAVIKTLQVGDALVTNQVFIVLPIAKGFGMSAGMPMDGVIGYEVLSRFVTTFDYGNKKVVFHMPGSYTPPPDATVVPIALYGTQPQFACGIDDVPSDVHARYWCERVRSRSIRRSSKPIRASYRQSSPSRESMGSASAAPLMGRLGRVQTLSFGGLTLHDLVGDYPTQGEGGFDLPFIGANVGGGVWKRFTMTLDYRRLTMTLTPNADFGYAINGIAAVSSSSIKAGSRSSTCAPERRRQLQD